MGKKKTNTTPQEETNEPQVTHFEEDPQTSKLQCLTENCTNKPEVRGLCGKCYSAACVMVRNKKTTWEYLEKRGFANPSKRDTRSANLFAAQLATADLVGELAAAAPPAADPATAAPDATGGPAAFNGNDSPAALPWTKKREEVQPADTE